MYTIPIKVVSLILGYEGVRTLLKLDKVKKVEALADEFLDARKYRPGEGVLSEQLVMVVAPHRTVVGTENDLEEKLGYLASHTTEFKKYLGKKLTLTHSEREHLETVVNSVVFTMRGLLGPVDPGEGPIERFFIDPAQAMFWARQCMALQTTLASMPDHPYAFIVLEKNK